jgi:hypothetical protein
MRTQITVAAAIAAALVVTGCETTSSRPYNPSTQNILAAQSALGQSAAKVQISQFAAASDVNTAPSCRALGALELAPGQSPITYLQEAFRQELFMAGLYAQTGTAITGEVRTLMFNSFGTGSWDIGLFVSSSALPAGYEVATHYEFKTSFSAINACQNVIDAFNPATSDVLGKVIGHPQFRMLAGAR